MSVGTPGVNSLDHTVGLKTAFALCAFPGICVLYKTLHSTKKIASVSMPFPCHSTISTLLHVFHVTVFSMLLCVFHVTLCFPCYCVFHVTLCFPCYSVFSGFPSPSVLPPSISYKTPFPISFPVSRVFLVSFRVTSFPLSFRVLHITPHFPGVPPCLPGASVSSLSLCHGGGPGPRCGQQLARPHKRSY